MNQPAYGVVRPVTGTASGALDLWRTAGTRAELTRVWGPVEMELAGDMAGAEQIRKDFAEGRMLAAA